MSTKNPLGKIRHQPREDTAQTERQATPPPRAPETVRRSRGNSGKWSLLGFLLIAGATGYLAWQRGLFDGLMQEPSSQDATVEYQHTVELGPLDGHVEEGVQLHGFVELPKEKETLLRRQEKLLEIIVLGAHSQAGLTSREREEWDALVAEFPAKHEGEGYAESQDLLWRNFEAKVRGIDPRSIRPEVEVLQKEARDELQALQARVKEAETTGRSTMVGEERLTVAWLEDDLLPYLERLERGANAIVQSRVTREELAQAREEWRRFQSNHGEELQAWVKVAAVETARYEEGAQVYVFDEEYGVVVLQGALRGQPFYALQGGEFEQLKISPARKVEKPVASDAAEVE